MIQHYPFEVLPLPYLYDSLEPNINMETMFFHHSKHLAAYVDNLNALLRPYPQFHEWTLERLLLENQELPEDIRTKVRNNAGGVYNHQLYFAGMSPNPTHLLGKLKDALLLDFGTWESFYETFFQMAVELFGSGNLWLAADERGKLVILPLPNQDTPLPKNLTPVLNLDVWEHAYYLEYQNLRAEYIHNWFRIINWTEAERRYEKALLNNLLCRKRQTSQEPLPVNKEEA
ncbi:MAG: superoxide dismutase [Lachnospiraceae bacterium]|nr:superoxide dismutase [Lachnospiraceae bacterium]